MPKANDIEYRVATDDEMLQARELFETCFTQTADEERWRYKYFENPAGPVIAFAAFDGDKLASILPSHPSRFSVFGEEVIIYQSGDIMTHPDYRRRGIYNHLKKMSGRWLQERGVPFTIGFPNSNALEANKKFGYTILGGMTRWVKVLQPGGKSAGRKALAYAAFPIISALRRKARAEDIARINTFPTSVTEIPRRLGRLNGVFGIRSAAFLNWRYPELDGVTAAWISNPETPDGYLIAEQSARGFWIRDLAAERRGKRTAMNLLAALTEYAESEGAQHIVFQYLGKSYNQTLLKSGFIPMPGRAHVALYPYSMNIQRLKNKRDWQLMDADRDLEL